MFFSALGRARAPSAPPGYAYEQRIGFHSDHGWKTVSALTGISDQFAH